MHICTCSAVIDAEGGIINVQTRKRDKAKKKSFLKWESKESF